MRSGELFSSEHQTTIHGTGVRSFGSMKPVGRQWGRGEMGCTAAERIVEHGMQWIWEVKHRMGNRC